MIRRQRQTWGLGNGSVRFGYNILNDDVLIGWTTQVDGQWHAHITVPLSSKGLPVGNFGTLREAVSEIEIMREVW